MHQPYYNNLLTNEVDLPWVRLHGVKDYLDMVTILEKYPQIHQTFNLVPSLIEQIKSLVDGSVNEKFLRLSRKTVSDLTTEERWFIIDNFFMADESRVISSYPRYYELFLLKKENKEFNDQDLLDLQVWFNLAWLDPCYKEDDKQLSNLVKKARFFSEQDKQLVLDFHIEILKKIIPTYKRFQDSGQIEVSVSPFYHPILPLLYNTKISKTANKNAKLPNQVFRYPKDCFWQIKEAVNYYEDCFGVPPTGMWPSEEAISKQIMPLIIKSGIKWIVSDEALLLKTLKKRERDPESIYQPYKFETKIGSLKILFRDANLSNLISFLYQHWDAAKAVNDLMFHLENIKKSFKGKDCLVVIALDGENAWEYYKNDGREFLNMLYSALSNSKFIKTVTIKEYLNIGVQAVTLNKIASGSWINGDFTKWMGNPTKNKAWDLLSEARRMLEKSKSISDMAKKQIYILEGSDWFWWYGDKKRRFDELFRMHLRNFYKIINQAPSSDLNQPLE